MHGAYGTGHQIAYSGFFERSDEERKEVRFLHERFLWLRVGGILVRRGSGACGAWREPLLPRRFSRAPGRRTTFPQRSFRGSAALEWGAMVRGSFFWHSVMPFGNHTGSHLLGARSESHIQQHFFHISFKQQSFPAQFQCNLRQGGDWVFQLAM